MKRSTFKQALASYKLRPGLSKLVDYAVTQSIEGEMGARSDAKHNIVLFMDSSENGDKDKLDNLFVQCYLAKDSSFRVEVCSVRIILSNNCFRLLVLFVILLQNIHLFVWKSQLSVQHLNNLSNHFS